MINEFCGKYDFLSNFYMASISIEGTIWPASEYLYQASKTHNIDDQRKIREASSPGKAKRLGRTIDLRPDWEDVKENTMLEITHLKFQQYPELAQKLIATGNQELIESNCWHDNEWGNCNCSKCYLITGKNLLGKILMQVRKELNS